MQHKQNKKICSAYTKIWTWISKMNDESITNSAMPPFLLLQGKPKNVILNVLIHHKVFNNKDRHRAKSVLNI
jgi:hypothetical protein